MQPGTQLQANPVAGRARGVEDEPHRVSRGGRVEEQQNSSGADGSWGLAMTSDEDGQQAGVRAEDFRTGTVKMMM